MLMFRAANVRGNQILEADVSVTLARNVVTSEGATMRRLEELRVVRPRSSMFALTWTVMHSLDATSPLRDADSERGIKAGAAGFGVEVGIDGRERAEKQAADVGESAGAARRDAPLGAESVEGAEGMVDALGVLEAAGPLG